ncbi:TonB family protein [Trinickia caryophylli]|uniref:Protein TonB n=1 Tax=Trinickia caryophylli TaxID=28094 RepID=A0A1X7CKF8_TRICW|nr:TonB family protein [Trinickia caryophylli]PMS09054.1 energy transducer TonB [Trinickia caryophylli]TRX20005.1 TonB family protein [Trinickia caryophylli]WQE12651.1 TonB family protein [Trinickia caryophylli]SME98399.1 protein TonB [Trinickia caryophylli]GLU30353.1 lipoprotein [Trinickia caryophylli]
MTAAFVRRLPAPRARGYWLLLPLIGSLLFAGGCTFTPPGRPSALTLPPPAAVNSATLDEYRLSVARRIVERNPSYVNKRAPQAMLRSLVVVAFTVDREGKVASSSIYRTNGDDEAEATALATLRRASPLPPPPPRLLNRVGQIEILEDWLFNDDGKFQLRELATPQAQALD